LPLPSENPVLRVAPESLSALLTVSNMKENAPFGCFSAANVLQAATDAQPIAE